MSIIKKLIACLACAMMSIVASAGEYPDAGNSTEPNVWTRNYFGVLTAASQTGYPIFLIAVNSSGCSHCSTMMRNTVNTDEFAEMDKEFTFYKVIMDQPYSSGSSAWKTCLNRYKGYFNHNMFPAVVVIRRDGSAYGGFGNNTTDSRGVVSDLRVMMESLAEEQGVDIRGGGSVSPIRPQPKPKVSVETWASRLKGKAKGVVFDANQDPVGTCVIKVAAKGSVNVKFVGANSKEAAKGSLALDDETPVVRTGTLDLAYNAATRMWQGKWGRRMVFAAAAADSSYDGTYTMGAECVANGKAGYFSLTVKRGKGKVSGMLDGKNKVAANGEAMVLPASVVAEQLGKWDSGEDLLFVPVVKRGGVSGGIVLSKGGTAQGILKALGSSWEMSGGKWSSSTNLKAMDGMVFSVSGRGIDIPVVSSGGSQLGFGANGYSAKIKAAVRSGLFKGNLKNGKEKIPFAGALVRDGKTVVGRGVTTGKGASHPVVIDSPCGGDCSQAE